MCERQPLQQELVIFTGTPKSMEVFDVIRRYGGTPISCPLIRTAEVIEPTDALRAHACPSYDWLIFTSQSAVEAFGQKLKRHAMNPEQIPGKIAAVGTRTAAALEKLGFQVDFIPTIFSADTFVHEFQPSDNEKGRLLFLKGNLASGTIKGELPYEVDEWTVYETVPAYESIDELISYLQTEQAVTVLFASPSAVDVYDKEIVPTYGWDVSAIGAIGHVTEKALYDAGAHVDVVPERYTLMDLVQSLVQWKEGKK